MVTEKEMAERVFVKPKEMQGTSSYVTAGEMKRFEQNKELNNDVYEVINNFAKKNNIKPKYEGLEDICQLSETTLKKSVAGTIKITRPFLYKLTVGLHMSLEEANKLFAKCGGILRDDCVEDYICMRALEHGDDIMKFIDQFNEFTQRLDKHQTVNKLKNFTNKKGRTSTFASLRRCVIVVSQQSH